MRDNSFDYQAKVALAAGTYTGSTDGATIALNCQGISFDLVTGGTVTTADATNYFTIKLQHGDLANGSDMADVDAEDMIVDNVPGGTPGRINATTKTSQVITTIGYRGNKKKYVRAVLVETGTASAICYVQATLDPRTKPATRP